MKHHLLFVACIIFIVSCSPSKQIAKSAKQVVLNDSALYNAHIGISIYEPATGKYLYNYQGDKYFVPASNTKIPTCYAAMKYLGDSLVGARYLQRGNDVHIYGTADPSFCHPDFKFQPVLQFVKSLKGFKVHLNRSTDSNYNYDNTFRPYGSGWPRNDFAESYMPERSAFPMYGNTVRFEIDSENKLVVTPAYFFSNVWFIKNDTVALTVIRSEDRNSFIATGSKKGSRTIEIPFETSDYFVNTTAGNKISKIPDSLFSSIAGYPVSYGITGWQFKGLGWYEKNYYGMIHSQPTDSLLKPMMHRSDNFFAEQSLLMVSNEMLGVMNDAKIIDSLLKTDFEDLPQKPRWADGSGLSRYNLFTPKDMVAILNKMQNEFGMERIKEIFPTGGEGTLSSYYKSSQGFIFAKTGTLSGVVALSGFLYTKKNKLLIFSVLVNNHTSSATQIRRAVEKFITGIRESY